MKTRTRRRFDCVAMKRRIQEQIARETRGMTRHERLAYIRRQVAESPFAELFKQPEPGAVARER